MGAKASCVDGPGGKVIRVIIDPATKTVTHLVIEPKHRVGSGRLVPLDLVDRVVRPEGPLAPADALTRTGCPVAPELMREMH